MGGELHRPASGPAPRVAHRHRDRVVGHSVGQRVDRAGERQPRVRSAVRHPLAPVWQADPAGARRGRKGARRGGRQGGALTGSRPRPGGPDRAARHGRRRRGRVRRPVVARLEQHAPPRAPPGAAAPVRRRGEPDRTARPHPARMALRRWRRARPVDPGERRAQRDAQPPGARSRRRGPRPARPRGLRSGPHAGRGPRHRLAPTPAVRRRHFERDGDGLPRLRAGARAIRPTALHAHFEEAESGDRRRGRGGHRRTTRSPDRARAERLGPGDFVFHPAYGHHTIRNPGESPVTYVMFKWRGEPSGSETTARLVQCSAPPQIRAGGGRRLRPRACCSRQPTAFLARLHAHLTVLQPGARLPVPRGPARRGDPAAGRPGAGAGREAGSRGVLYLPAGPRTRHGERGGGAGALHGLRIPGGPAAPAPPPEASMAPGASATGWRASCTPCSPAGAGASQRRCAVAAASPAPR